MLGSWESGRKVDIARKFLIEMIDSLENLNNVEMALRVYGHQSIVPPQDCNDTRLEVPFKPGNAGEIRQTLRFLEPKGTTPIAHSLEMAANDFPSPSNGARNVILLITDGVEACDGDPCTVSQKLQHKGIILKPYIIGIGTNKDFNETFQCAGNFLPVDREESFSGTLDYVVNQVLNKTTTQINLLDSNGNATQTNVPMTFYDHVSGKIKYQYVHTLNSRGDPDTLYLDPLLTYDLTVHTLPPIRVSNLSITPGQHTIIGLDAPQGSLRLSSPNTNLHRQVVSLIKKRGTTLNTQKIDETQKYICGLYNLEVLTLPRLFIDSVSIKPNHTTTIEIPRPGLVTVFKPATGYGSIFIDRNNKLEWVTNLHKKNMRETFTLLPGYYHIVFRTLRSNKTLKTIRKQFKISSGQSIPIKL